MKAVVFVITCHQCDQICKKMQGDKISNVFGNILGLNFWKWSNIEQKSSNLATLPVSAKCFTIMVPAVMSLIVFVVGVFAFALTLYFTLRRGDSGRFLNLTLAFFIENSEPLIYKTY